MGPAKVGRNPYLFIYFHDQRTIPTRAAAQLYIVTEGTYLLDVPQAENHGLHPYDQNKA